MLQPHDKTKRMHVADQGKVTVTGDKYIELRAYQPAAISTIMQANGADI